MNVQPIVNRPHTTVILAMSADGKISDEGRSPARFGSEQDQLHLQQKVAGMDGVLFGAGTLNAYQTTIRIMDSELLEMRKHQGKPPQPVQIVVSASGKLNSNWRFFKQPVPHWLLTTLKGQELWTETQAFEKIIVAENNYNQINWLLVLEQLKKLGLNRLGILGGGQLIATLFQENLIDELWLTICPLILGGRNAPTPVDGEGFLSAVSPRLQLLEVKTVGQEVFLHYQVS